MKRWIPIPILVLALLEPASAFGQGGGQIQGKVVDAAAAPLPGVAVSVQGTARGATTGADGTYRIADVPAGTRQLRATLVGYGETVRSVSVVAGQVATVDLVMTAQAVALEEMVVVGYGTARRSDLTGATSPIRTEEIEDLPLTSMEQALQGRAAGVQVVQNNGKPGGGFTVRIRGGNSMQGGSDPLYVVDGFPVAIDGDAGRSVMSLLDPDNIQSIEILKDASATAIYGARGANGVVMITTKKGRVGGRVDFEAYTGIQKLAKQVDVMNARQYAQMVNDWARTRGSEQPFADLDHLPYDTDWQDLVFRTAPIQNYSLTLSGGTEQARYLISGNYLDQQGIVRSSGFDRASFRVNLDGDVGSRLRLSNQTLFARTRNDEVLDGEGGVVHNSILAPPTTPVHDEDGNYYDYAPDYFWFSGDSENPIMDINEITDGRTSYRLLQNISGDYRLLQGLTARARFGVDFMSTSTDFYATRLHELGGTGGSARRADGRYLVYLNENTLNYEGDVGAESRVNLTGGFTWQKANSRSAGVAASGFVNDLLGDRVIGTGSSISPPSYSETDWMLLSWLGRANYSLMDRYLLTITGRADGSSRFGEGNKWGFFPSAAVAWRVSEEPFLRNSDLLSNLKLRLGWGRTGNQDIGLYQSLQRISADVTPISNGLATAFAPSNIANPDLKWETTEQWNAGLDVGLWDERLSITADAYVKNTRDLLASVTLPASSGFTSMLQNIGRIRNTGVELAVGAVPIESADVQWTIDANISTNRNEVVKLAGGNEFIAGGNGLSGVSHLVREGEPLSVFYVFKEDGLDANGNVQYVDKNEDGAITDEDRFVLGDAYPDLTYGLSSSLSVGRFDVNATLQGIHGNLIYNALKGYHGINFAYGDNQLADLAGNYWVPWDPDPNAKYPRLDPGRISPASDRFLEDGSYLRLKSVRVGYRVPSSAVGWTGADDVMVYVSGQNLFTLTGYSWYDPEVNQNGGSDLRIGVDFGTYPPARTFTVGMRVGL